MKKEQYIMFDSPEAAQYRENIKDMTYTDRIKQLENTHDYENLKDRFGALGKRLYQVVQDAKKMNRELDIIHKCLTELYNYPDNKVGDIVRKYLDIVEKDVKP